MNQDKLNQSKQRQIMTNNQLTKHKHKETRRLKKPTIRELDSNKSTKKERLIQTQNSNEKNTDKHPKTDKWRKPYLKSKKRAHTEGTKPHIHYHPYAKLHHIIFKP